VNLFKVLLNWAKIAAGLAAAIPLLEELAVNDYETAGTLILSYGDVEDLVADIPPELKPYIEPLLPKLAARFAEKLDKLIPEEALLKLLPH
jgi:hypothetical protein